MQLKRSKAGLLAAVTTLTFLFATPAIATMMAYRNSALFCVPATSTGFHKLNMPAGIPGAIGVIGPDWGVTTSNRDNDSTVYCPVQIDVPLTGHQPLVSATMMLASTSDLKCTFYVQEGTGGGVMSSTDLTGNSGSMTSTITVTQLAPGYEMATPNLNRGFFLCILPRQNSTTGASTGLLKAIEIQYGI